MQKAKLTGITKECSIEAIGDVRAISGKRHHSKKEKATGLNGKFYIKTDTHTFENNAHNETDLSWKNTMEDGDGTLKDSPEERTEKCRKMLLSGKFHRISFGEKL